MKIDQLLPPSAKSESDWNYTSFPYMPSWRGQRAIFPFSKFRSTWSINLTTNYIYFFYVFLSVRLSINLVNDQIDAQFFYFIIRLLQSSTCFEQRHAHHQEVKFY